MKTKTLDLITKLTPDLLNKKVQWEENGILRAGLVMSLSGINILINRLHIYGSTKGWQWFKLSELINIAYYQTQT